jgi:hypothetical protein
MIARIRALVLSLCLAFAFAAPVFAAPAKTEANVVQAMDQPLVVAPVVRNGRLVNYLFVSVRIELAPSGDVFKHLEKAHFVREAMLMASHKTMMADGEDNTKLNEDAASAAFLAAASEVLGPKAVKGVSIVEVHSLK